MDDLLFDVPWWIPTVLAIVGIILLVSGNRRQNNRIGSAGTVLILIAVGWAVMSYLVDTPKEICQKQTRAMVRSVLDRDWNKFDGLLAPDVTFRFTGSTWQIAGRETISSDVKQDVDQIGLHGAHITDIRAAENAGTITVSFKVFTTQDLTMDRPLDSEWETDWQKSQNQWRLREIRAIRVSGVTADQVRGSLRAR